MDPTKLTSSILAISVVVGTIVLTALRVEVPAEMWAGAGVVLGFYFGMPAGEATTLRNSR